MNFKYAFHLCFFLITLSANLSYAAADNFGKPKSVEVVVGLVNQHCGVCHNVPSPALMPKKSWPFVVKSMAELSAKLMGREFISAEVIRDITAYYYGSSPASLPLLPYQQDSDSPLGFLASELGNQSKMPLVINVKSVELRGGGSVEFLVCDGERSEVLLLTRAGKTWRETKLAEVQVPAHTEVVDYDQDGDKDIIVADLGLFPPSDKLAGKVLLLRQNISGNFDKEILIEGIGRVTDARAVDVDGDRDLDLAIAVFGGGVAGELIWLENLGGGKHAKQVLLNFSGALNVSPVDLNADGKVDFVSLIAQEHEMIVALINSGNGKFDPVVLSRAPHPMYGSTSMGLVDLDGDDDVDILFTNGDAHDTQMEPKPYHGVQWLENKGKFTFQFHNIGRFYGAANAAAGDLDADGDLDVVAGSWLNYWEDDRRQSLIWFENDGQQNFTRHNIINKPPGIVSLELKDITGDDRLDIVAGVFRMDLLKSVLDNPDNPKKHRELSAENPARELLKSRIILLENKVVIKDPK